MLCSTVLTLDEVEEIDATFADFVHDIHRICNRRLTPNMHLHLHIYSSIKSYGPTYAFWHFGFERLNGFLGSYKTNKKLVEIEMMRKFINCSSVSNVELPNEFQFELGSVLRTLLDDAKAPLGSLAMSFTDSPNLISLLNLQTTTACTSPSKDTIWLTTVEYYEPFSTHSTSALSSAELECMKQIYIEVYGPLPTSTIIPSIYTTVTSVDIAGGKIGSSASVHDRSSCIVAAWEECGQVALDGEVRPGKLTSFLNTLFASMDNGGSIFWHQCHGFSQILKRIGFLVPVCGAVSTMCL